MATQAVAVAGQQGALPQTTKQDFDPKKFKIGTLAGLEWSRVKNADLSTAEKAAVKDLVTKAEKRDYPARLIEIIQAWEAALFFRGFQFLIPQRNGGWVIPGEGTGYGPSMQMDLALLPTNIYSSYGQILISALTRSVPPVRFEPQNANNNAQITAAESAEKFIKVVERNNDLIMVQTDAARYLYTDGRAVYWTRFEKNGQKYGWEENAAPGDMIPETEPPTEQALQMRDAQVAEQSPPTETDPAIALQEETGQAGSNGSADTDESGPEGEGEVEQPAALETRTPIGQEVRSAHGKLETKVVPMTANSLEEAHAFKLDFEVDESIARAMFPWCADDIKGGEMGTGEGSIARLARLNVKLGMQSTYITSDTVADDVTISRTWMRPGYLMKVADKAVRQSLLQKFPDGCLVVYAGDCLCYARNESMDDSIALMQAFSGDGQNRNALGTSMMPVQKRVNNWLDLMNDYFVRSVPKKYMDSKCFNVEALKQQTNVPGDIAPFSNKSNRPVNELIFVEPEVQPPAQLSAFVQQYIGPLSELLTGAYPALSGGDTGSNDTAHGIAIQRDQALGRLGPTWHSISNAESKAMLQAVKWGAKCRDGSVNERIPGGETISLEINNLRANILCFAESDENIPESFTQKQNKLMQFMEWSAKNPLLQEVLFNAANLEYIQTTLGVSDVYIPQVEARNKQLGEIELLLKAPPVPNPKLAQALQALTAMQAKGVPAEQFAIAAQQIQQLKQSQPLVSSVPIDEQIDDSATEAETCWQWLCSPNGRKAKNTNQGGYANVKLHYLEHVQAASAKNAQNQNQQKPPSKAINLKDLVGAERASLLAQGGIQFDAAAEARDDAAEIAKAAAPKVAPGASGKGPDKKPGPTIQ